MTQRVQGHPAGLSGKGDEAPVPAPATDKRLLKASEEFEAMFVQQMLRQMRETNRSLSGDDSLFHGQSGSEMLEWADQEMARVLSRQHAYGIADAILHQLRPPDGATG